MAEQSEESFTRGLVTYKKGADGKWYFNVKAKNGEIVAQSEGYEKLAGAMNGVLALHEAMTTGDETWPVKRGGE